jgi:hypothetical protein
MSTLLGQYDKLAYLHGRVDSWSRSLFRPRSAPPDSERLERIERLGREYREASDAELRGACDELKQLHRGNHSPVAQDGTVETAFALLREASRRTTGLVHYTEQLLGGLALVRGAIAEMATGEGKTLAISLPALVFSLAGKGVHVVTVNSYLARRDYEFTKPMLDLLGVSVGLLPEGSDATLAKKRAAYECDITYAVGYELGFDYMRDQLAIMRHPHGGPGDDLRNALLGKTPEAAPTCQRDLAIAIIDEVDSVLIDEAGCPLLISESSTEAGSPDPYLRARDLSRQLREGHHFLIDRHRRAIELTGEGRSEIHLESHQVPWDELRRPWEIYLRNALKADHLFHRDDQYVVMDGKVVIVDEFTGRRFADRTWREGLHQAVEAKEAVEIRAENSSAASITRQRYFALYETVCGLTGTASESAGEFWRFFRLPVVPIPLHRPCRRPTSRERPARAGRHTDDPRQRTDRGETPPPRHSPPGPQRQAGCRGRCHRRHRGRGRQRPHRHEHGRTRHPHRPLEGSRSRRWPARHRRGKKRIREDRPPAHRSRGSPGAARIGADLSFRRRRPPRGIFARPRREDPCHARRPARRIAGETEKPV